MAISPDESPAVHLILLPPKTKNHALLAMHRPQLHMLAISTTMTPSKLSTAMNLLDPSIPQQLLNSFAYILIECKTPTSPLLLPQPDA
jgi:hypothetical protein